MRATIYSGKAAATRRAKYEAKRAAGRSLQAQADEAKAARAEAAGDLRSAQAALGDDFPSEPGGCAAPFAVA